MKVKWNHSFVSWLLSVLIHFSLILLRWGFRKLSGTSTEGGMGRKMKRAFRRLIPPNTFFNPCHYEGIPFFTKSEKKRQKQKTDKKKPCNNLKRFVLSI